MEAADGSEEEAAAPFHVSLDDTGPPPLHDLAAARSSLGPVPTPVCAAGAGQGPGTEERVGRTVFWPMLLLAGDFWKAPLSRLSVILQDESG